MEFTVTAYVNVSPDNFGGLQSGHHIAEVDTYAIEAEDTHGAAEGMFVVGNRMGSDAHGKDWPSAVRSLSKGDLLKVTTASLRGEQWMACASVGWSEVPEPTQRIVPLVGSSAHWDD